jgi:hypothetical protein
MTWLQMAEPINLELPARHLQAIRGELREMLFHAENDRRNVRSQFDNLAATLASRLGDVEARMAARLDGVATLLGERFGYLDERIAHLDERITGLETQVARNTDRTEQLIVRIEQLLRDR